METDLELLLVVDYEAKGLGRGYCYLLFWWNSGPFS